MSNEKKNAIVKVRCAKEWIEDMERVAKDAGYSSLSEYIRESAEKNREVIEQMKRR